MGLLLSCYILLYVICIAQEIFTAWLSAVAVLHPFHSLIFAPARPILSIHLRIVFIPLQYHPQWIPERDDPRFDQYLPKPPPQAHPLWKDQAAYVFDENTKLQCRMDQAKALTKTIVVDGLPVEVEVRRYVSAGLVIPAYALMYIGF